MLKWNIRQNAKTENQNIIIQKKDQKAVKSRIIRVINLFNCPKALYCNDFDIKKWKISLLKPSILLQMTLVKFNFSTWKGINIWLFYQMIVTFSFKSSDKIFFNQIYANYIKKRSRKNPVQTSKHQRSCKRKEKCPFLLLFPRHTLCWSKSPKPQMYLFTICTSRDHRLLVRF